MAEKLDRVNDTSSLTAAEPDVESVMAALNPGRDPMTDDEKREKIRAAVAEGRLYPREVAQLEKTGWLASAS